MILLALTLAVLLLPPLAVGAMGPAAFWPALLVPLYVLAGMILDGPPRRPAPKPRHAFDPLSNGDTCGRDL